MVQINDVLATSSKEVNPEAAINETRAQTRVLLKPKEEDMEYHSNSNASIEQPENSAQSPLSTSLPNTPNDVDCCRSASRMEEVYRRETLSWFDKTIDKMCMKCTEPERTGCLHKIVSSKGFESIMLMVILMNAISTFRQTNMQMSDPHMLPDATLRDAEVVFTTLYVVELILKFSVHRIYLFFNEDRWWNIFDVIIVGVGIVEIALGGTSDTGVNPQFVRIMRIFRMVKILRIVRAVQFVKELRVILNCIFGSFHSLMWSIILLGGISMLFAVFLVQLLTSALADGQLAATQIEGIHEQFSTVQQASLTLFKSISGGEDWGPIFDLISSCGVIPSVCFLVYMAFIWLSVTNIITAVFVDKALQNAKPDAEDALLSQHKVDLERMSELQMLFRSMDTDNSGTLTLGELKNSCKDDRIMSFFEMMNLDIKSVEAFFKLLTQVSHSDVVDMESFVTGCLKMRGYATNADVYMILFQSRVLGAELLLAMEKFKLEVQQMHSKVTGVAA